MRKYKNIIFDVGEVLLEYRWYEMLTKDRGLTPERAKLVGEAMFDSPMWHEMDLWSKSMDEIYEEFREAYPQYYEDIRWFIEHGEEMKVARPDVWERVAALKDAGYHLYLLSNYPKNLFDLHTSIFPFWDKIDGKVVSYEIHITKPDIEIYQHLIRKYQLDPKESLFFDDRPGNIEGAKACGISGIQVTSREQLIRELDALLEE